MRKRQLSGRRRRRSEELPRRSAPRRQGGERGREAVVELAEEYREEGVSYLYL
jgi:hypothetical protein